MKFIYIKNIFIFVFLLFSQSGYSQLSIYGINIEKYYITLHPSKEDSRFSADGLDIKLKGNPIFASVQIRDSGNTIYYYPTTKSNDGNSYTDLQKVKLYVQSRIANPLVISDVDGKIISIPNHVLWKTKINNKYYFFSLSVDHIIFFAIYKSTSEEAIDKQINESVEHLRSYNNYNELKWYKSK